MERDDRVAYIYYMLEEKKTRAFIYKFIEQLGVTSKSTAERVIKKLDMNKQLFLAAYTPVKNDIEAVEEALGVKASKVSNGVKKEPVLKDGDIIEHDSKRYKFVYTGKTGLNECDKCCLNCGSENCICENKIDLESVPGYFVEVAETDTLEEIAVKNEELQKELHTSKNVIETLQKGIEELNETITESKIAIAEVCKERDDKEEEIRVLSLELQKYKNDLNSVLDDRQKLECLLHDSIHNNDESKEFRELETKYDNLLEVLETKNLDITLNPKYDSLYKVLLSAYNQASCGKGKERHQLNDEEPFENQKICEIARRLSIDYNLGQAVKKIYESKRLTDGRDIAELYGAINYIAAAIIVKQEEKNET